VPTIPQRELRNDVAAILRRAEAGETFTVTVNGRPVAELRPLPTPPATSLSEIFAATPVDAGWADELTTMRRAERSAAEAGE
jgi:prevent-host-death family protein